MRCFFLSHGHIAAVEVLEGLLDEEAIKTAHTLFLERTGFEGFEVWDGERFVMRHSPGSEEWPKAVHHINAFGLSPKAGR